MTRTYFRSSIYELETLFETRSADGSVLEALEDELTYRKTERAAKLRRRVKTRLAQLGIQSGKNGLPALQQSTDYSDFTSANLRGQIKNHSHQATPHMTNTPESILSAWTALEVLSPPHFRRPEDLAAGDRTRVAKLDEHQLPWERGDESRPKFQLYYQIVLGAIQMEPAVELLAEHYGDTRIEKPRAPGNAALAVVIVDKEGCLAGSPAVAVSSFGWGVITALKGELEDLGQWPDVESRLTARIENILRNQSSHATYKTPLTRDRLMTAYEDLVGTLDLPADWLEPPQFAIRSYTYFKDQNPPEPILLNSFYLSDLAFAKQLFLSQKAPRNLRRYLGLERPAQTKDLIRDNEALEDAVSPQKTPLARWPGPGRHPLVLLQQAAVNIAFCETATGGLIGINGPPGTGKTTLLRDLVAGVVTQLHRR